MTPAPEKPALRVIEGYKGPPLPRRPKLPTDGELILPPIKLPWKEVFSTWLGMTSRQANPAFYQVAAIDGEKAAAASASPGHTGQCDRGSAPAPALSS
jgi:hypothetical protein